MPKREDIKSILLIGSGPIVIGQACEFDYSGTQACKALRQEGYRVILVNSNPATIMTDPETADRTYVEPLTPDVLEQIIARERPDALLPTVGGQTGLNLALELAKRGVLERYGVELIGASLPAIRKAEDREAFKAAMISIGLRVTRSGYARTREQAYQVIAEEELTFPIILRPSYTLGGFGGNVAYNAEELDDAIKWGLDASPASEILVEESIIGWKEYELEVMRDRADNCVIVCSIENLDAMGVHTGDSITVAPAQTLSDKEYQRMRDAAIAIMREIGVDTGGSNVQFAINPADGRMIVVEMNPRVSRSSALASKATGFPIAKIAARLAVGYTLDEIRNDITGSTPACFEPTIDYVVTKIPRFTFEKFPETPAVLTTQMKSVGEVMAMGRTFRESLQKAMRSLETGRSGFDVLRPVPDGEEATQALVHDLRVPNPDRLWAIGDAFRAGMGVAEIHEATGVDPWFLHHIQQIITLEGAIAVADTPDAATMRLWKREGFADARIAALRGVKEAAIRELRHGLGVRPVMKRVDTCAAEFEALTPYLYSTYEGECEAAPTHAEKVVILGSGPNRIGQGIEFDYCCVHGAMALSAAGFETIMVNCNPETVSTDYDTSDRLYFEPLTLEDVLEVLHIEKPKGVILQFGGQTPLKLATALDALGIPILGTPTDAIDRAEDRERFGALVRKLGLRQPRNGLARTEAEALRIARGHRLPHHRAPQLCTGRPRHGDRLLAGRHGALHAQRRAGVARPPGAHRRVPRGRRRAGRGRAGRRHGRGHRRRDAAHRGGWRSLGRLGLLAAAPRSPRARAGRRPRRDGRDGARAGRHRADERSVRRARPHRLRPRGQPARLAHRALRVQGDRRAHREAGRPRDGGRDAARAGLHPRGHPRIRVGQGGGLPVQPLPGQRHAAGP
jgi:carbamoyl-phosphate synthase large subunit